MHYFFNQFTVFFTLLFAAFLVLLLIIHYLTVDRKAKKSIAGEAEYDNIYIRNHNAMIHDIIINNKINSENGEFKTMAQLTQAYSKDVYEFYAQLQQSKNKA